MNEALKNRHEIVFLYDVSWANPNGDPMDENKPRIDEEAGINIVTDVRLKRTVRDALIELGYKVFLREERNEDYTLLRKDDLFEKYYKASPQEVVKQCIDIRLFGGTFALKPKKHTKESEKEAGGQQAFALTGPVQFKFGHTLHKVKVEFIKGTSIMPTDKGKTQGGPTEVYVLPYALIVFYGMANEKAAEFRRNGQVIAQLTEDDLEAMLKALWVGHKASTDVITRSKFGHEPRLLLDIVYKPGTLTHMGELDKLVAFHSEKSDEAIRDITDGVVDLSNLAEKVAIYKDKIEKVRHQVGDRVRLEPALEAVFEGVVLKPFPWSDEL